MGNIFSVATGLRPVARRNALQANGAQSRGYNVLLPASLPNDSQISSQTEKRDIF
jgi:hypothetical protein